MPQTFHVLKCYNCENFQVHIVKKTNKWQCKICEEKQSVKKVYSQGMGKDCRLHCQTLNLARMKQSETLEQKIIESSYETNDETEILESPIAPDNAEPRSSKWNEYVLKQPSELEEDENASDLYTFERPKKKRKFTKNSNDENKKKTSKWGAFSQASKTMDENNLFTEEDENNEKSKCGNFIQTKTINDADPENNYEIKGNNSFPEENKKSKWGEFIQTRKTIEDADLEINYEIKENINFNSESKQSKWSEFIQNSQQKTQTNIFHTDDDNLDDVLCMSYTIM